MNLNDFKGEELRCYAFVNFYLSSIQQGIQHGHAAVDLVRKYRADGQLFHTLQAEMVAEWADNHKTFITLNGGNFEGIVHSLDVLDKVDFPYCTFHEDHASLCGLMTCVAVVLPEGIFNARWVETYAGGHWRSEFNRPDGSRVTHMFDDTEPEAQLIKHLRSCPLAR